MEILRSGDIGRHMTGDFPHASAQVKKSHNIMANRQEVKPR